MDCEILIIGSGPSGATTAALLAEAGHDVLLLEEGEHHGLDSAISYTMEELEQKYRNAGLTTTLGRTGVTYIEGRCVGGASEINAALYHRPKPEMLQHWRVAYQIDDFGPEPMQPWFTDTERDLSVSTRPDGLAPASNMLRAGAESLGWRSSEIPRCWKYTQAADGTWQGRRQSMTETMIPRALAAGCRLLPGTRALRLVIRAGEATAAVCRQGNKKLTVTFKRVILCAGAVQTPLLLRRSGVRDNIGDSLRMHPMIRLAARFREEINDPVWGVPVQQVEEFKPDLTLGCSHSSLPHISMWLGTGVLGQQRLLAEWRHLAVFYVAAVGQGTGRIRNLPLVNEPLIQYALQDADFALMGEGLYRLGELLLAAGATEIYSPIEGAPPLHGLSEFRDIRLSLPHDRISVSTIHLFSSCPMGEDRRRCAVDSFGRLHGYRNIHLHDASILPTSPGVNPQGTIMAIARRNTARLIAEL
jgi:choline dehydrogenase-like flavoprotein